MLLRKIKAAVQIFRPELPIAAGICVLVGEVIALGKIPSVSQLLLGFVSVFFISGSALVLNDYFDLEVDKINMPQRPLPSGILSPTDAILLTVVAIVIGLAAAWQISFTAFVSCVIAAIVGTLYNWKFKEAGLTGNLMVSFSVAFTFVFGGIAVGEPWNLIVWVFGSMAFLIDLGEEIAGDAMDMEGDKKRGSKSIAIRYGRQVALLVSAVCFGLVILISWVPVFMKWLGGGYLVMMAVMNAVLILFTIRLLKSKTPQEGRKAMRSIYMGASLGVLAFLIARMLE